MPAVALTIAGSDPSGGAGLQADLKTFHQFGVYGMAAVTLLTVQNTRSVTRVECFAPELIEAQIRAVLDDIPPGATKLGALGSADTVRLLARLAPQFRFPLVVDPVMISKHGAALLTDEAQQVFAQELLPHASLLTPNLPEAEALTGMSIRSIQEMRQAAVRLRDMGAQAVLIKGGHLPASATDVLYANGEWHEFPADHIPTSHTHGTGCTYAAAIAAGLAQGHALAAAVRIAKAYITAAIRYAPGLGHGAGPVNHHAPVPGAVPSWSST